MIKKEIILIFLFAISGFLYYDTLVVEENIKTVIVGKVIDGDTFVTITGQKVRLKGINTPEKNEPLYAEAKYFLKNRVENESMEIDVDGTDRYGRILAHSKENKALLEKGLAYLYYYEKDKYYNELSKAEEGARNEELGLWKKSKNEECIELVNLKYTESPKRCTNTEQLILKNNCNENLDIIIKDDATHIYKETINKNSLLVKNFSCIWNNDGDTLYVRDSEGLLIFYRY